MNQITQIICYTAVWCSIVLNRRQQRNDHQGRRRRELWWRTWGLQSCCLSWPSSLLSRSCQHFSWRYVWFHTTSSSSTSTSPTTSPTRSSTPSWTRYIHTRVTLRILTTRAYYITDSNSHLRPISWSSKYAKFNHFIRYTTIRSFNVRWKSPENCQFNLAHGTKLNWETIDKVTERRKSEIDYSEFS